MTFDKDKEAQLDRELSRIFSTPQETIAAERKRMRRAPAKRVSSSRVVKPFSNRARRVQERVLSPEAAAKAREKRRVGAWAHGTPYEHYYQGLRKLAAGGIHKTGVRAGKRKNRKEEDVEQMASVRWFNATYPAYANCLHASAGGVFSSIRAKAKMSDMGYRAGTPDFFFAIPAHGKPGAFAEMKKEHGGRLSDEQKIMIADLKKQGFEVRVLHGFREFIEFTEWWMSGVTVQL